MPMRNGYVSTVMLDDGEKARTAMLLEGVLELCEAANVPRSAIVAVLSKVLVVACLDDEDKDDFLARMAYVYDFERFMKPDSKEIH